MKKSDIKQLKAIPVKLGEIVKVEKGWEIIKEPTKITINNLFPRTKVRGI